MRLVARGAKTPQTQEDVDFWMMQDRFKPDVLEIQLSSAGLHVGLSEGLTPAHPHHPHHPHQRAVKRTEKTCEMAKRRCGKHPKRLQLG